MTLNQVQPFHLLFFYSESIASTGSNFSTLESSRRIRRHNVLSPNSLSRSTSRGVISPNPFSRSVSRASLSRSFTRRQLNLMQQEKLRRLSKEEVWILAYLAK